SEGRTTASRSGHPTSSDRGTTPASPHCVSSSHSSSGPWLSARRSSDSGTPAPGIRVPVEGEEVGLLMESKGWWKGRWSRARHGLKEAATFYTAGYGASLQNSVRVTPASYTCETADNSLVQPARWLALRLDDPPSWRGDAGHPGRLRIHPGR